MVGNTGVMVEMGDYDGLIVLTVCHVFTVLCMLCMQSMLCIVFILIICRDTRQDNIPTTELKLSSQDQTQHQLFAAA